MRTTLVYDLPTRLFHFIFSTLFVTAFFIAKSVDDESPFFSYHMLAGLLLGFTVILRIFWGFFGSVHARFSDFRLSITDLKHYLLGILRGSKEAWPGHNPASSWAAILMFFFSIGLAITGILMTSGHKEEFEDIHELLANGFLVTSLLHVSGVLFHMFVHRDGIALSMVNGKKALQGETRGSQQHLIAAMIFVIALSGFSMYLLKNYHSTEGTLNLSNVQLTLREE